MTVNNCMGSSRALRTNMQSRAEDVINAYEVIYDVATETGEVRQQVDEKLEQWYRQWLTMAQAG